MLCQGCMSTRTPWSPGVTLRLRVMTPWTARSHADAAQPARSWILPEARKTPNVSFKQVMKLLPVGIFTAAAHAGAVFSLSAGAVSCAPHPPHGQDQLRASLPPGPCLSDNPRRLWPRPHIRNLAQPPPAPSPSALLK